MLKNEGAWVGTISGYSEEEEKKKDLFIANETEIVLNPDRFGQKSSVLHFLYAPSEAQNGFYSVTVSEDGADIDTCGWEDLPCLIIHKATATKHKDTVTLSLLAKSHSPEDTQTTIDSSLTVSGSGDETHPVRKTVNKIGTSAIFVVSSGEVQFSSIVFLLNSSPDSLLAGSLFEHTGGKLTLTHVTVKPDEKLAADSQLSLGEHSLISISAGLTTSFNIIVERISTTQNGASVCATLNKKSSLTFAPTASFTNCTALYGGAIYIQLQETPSTLSFNHI